MSEEKPVESAPNELPGELPGKKLTRSQTYSVWAGVAGAVIGSSAWLIAMAGLSGDWVAVTITLALDAVVLFLFGRLCLRHPRSRFLLLGLMLVILTGHCLAVYWWRLDFWRAELNMPSDQLASQKKVVSVTVSAMVAIVLAQLLVMQWLQNKARRIRKA